MSGFEIAGIPLGAGALLLSIKGAVDGCRLLADVCAKDSGLSFAATHYYLQNTRLQLRKDRLNVVDEANGLLLKQPRITRDAVWRIVAEINATHELAVNFITKYDTKNAAVPTSAVTAPGIETAGAETFTRRVSGCPCSPKPALASRRKNGWQALDSSSPVSWSKTVHETATPRLKLLRKEMVSP
ncbi:hypothetical protein B0T26DRAFT_713881 [Lasiosphaeria miniovina]|uniref:Uncharacterized protein n=1 Tax=Lasiosphaeria miniovina TaxID=1954250 RepID=A0AA40AMT2_9PEZI|nr:uncharacterized protein B0T26DRAFT_713881 [Lasiosphaeria miniovina]KAK0718665.1 hypothetical protein B0T26DRAFT_713881 [Lasiosphaeria miniovina]